MAFIPGFGQELELSDFSAINGLPSLETYEVFQSRDGFIWIATDLGVARYDGYQLEIFTAKDGLPDPVVFGFSEDESGRIWFRTFSGKVAYYEAGKIYPYAASKQVETTTINTILYNLYFKKNTLYFSTATVLSAIDSSGKQKDKQIPIRRLAIQVDSDGKILSGFHGLSGLIKEVEINNKLFEIKLSDTTYHNKVLNVLSKNDTVYFTINSDVFLSDGHSCRKIFEGKNPIISLSLDKQGDFWVGYETAGVDKITIHHGKAKWITNKLKGKSVSRVLQDREGGMWFSTLESGVLHSSNPDYSYQTMKDKAQTITSKGDWLIIGYQSGQALIHNVKNPTLSWTINFESPIRSLYLDPKDRLWLSAFRMHLVDLTSKKIIREVGGGSTSISGDLNSGIWFVGGTRISRLKQVYEEPEAIHLEATHLKILPYDSIVFLSKRIGVDIFNITDSSTRAMPELANLKISDLFRLSNHEIIITTIGGGFYLYDLLSREVTSFSKENNFVANNIYCVTQSDSLIWMSTENGVLSFTAKSLKNKIPKVQTLGSWKKYPEEKIKHLLIQKDFIYGVSDFGILTIPQSKNIVVDVLPPFYYRIIQPSVTSTDKEIQLPAESSIQIKFGFISFTNQNIKTRYRLSKENTWIPITTREIFLNSLASGNHLLELESTIDNVNWVNNLTLKLNVATPWWKTWYALLLSILLIFAIVYLIFQSRLKVLREKESLLTLINDQREKLVRSEYDTMERERARIAKDFHDSVGTDLAAMKLVVKHLLQKGDPDSAQEIDDYFQNTIKEVRNIIQDLAPPMITQFGLMSSIDNYTSKVGAKFGKKIVFDWSGEEIKDNQFATIIFRTIQELISNSIKHSQCSIITLNIQSNQEVIKIDYSDNGIGFDLNVNYPGLGIRSILSRVEYLKGKLDFRSSSDGSQFNIEIPRNKV